MSSSISLIPVSGEHSVREAVISLFLATPLIKPERFGELIQTDFKSKFQQFEPLAQVQMKFNNNQIGQVESQPPSIKNNAGFRFTSFEGGKMTTVLQGINEELRNYISFHTLKYIGWTAFFKEFIEVLSSISKNQSDLFVTGFSLHYVDEFNSPTEIKVADVFNQNSKNLPKDFFSSNVNTFLLMTEQEIKGSTTYDRIEVTVVKIPVPKITISHNLTVTLQDFELMSNLIISPQLKELLDTAHKNNKETLIDILKQEVCKSIKIIE